MISIDWVTIVLKLVLVPTFVGAVSLTGRHWGPTVSGWLVGLPLTSGPVIFFLALEQGNTFAAAATQATMMGIISVAIFSLAYTRLAPHTSWSPSMIGGFLAWIGSTFLLENLEVGLVLGFVTVLCITIITVLLIPRVKSDRNARISPRWEIPGRMLSATILVFLITGVAQALGPKLTGLLTPFPIYATVLAVFTHHYETANHAIRLLRGVVAGSVTSTVFLLIVCSTIIGWGIGYAFLAAICVSSLTHTTIFYFLKSHN